MRDGTWKRTDRQSDALVVELSPRHSHWHKGVSVLLLVDPCWVQGQLSLAIPPWVGAMSTSQRVVMLCGLGLQAGMVCEWLAGKAVWSRCYDIRSSLTMSSSHIKGAIYKCCVRFFLLLPFCNHTSLFTVYVREMAAPRIFILEKRLHPWGGVRAGAF